MFCRKRTRFVRSFIEKGVVRKPGSVVDSHFSRTRIAACLKRSVPGGRRAASYLPIRSCSRRGLPGTAVACRPVSSCLTLSPLPGAETGRSALCCTFLWLAPTGRYPASCPAEPGLSSPAFAAATIRTTPNELYTILSRFRQVPLRSRRRVVGFLRRKGGAPAAGGRHEKRPRRFPETRAVDRAKAAARPRFPSDRTRGAGVLRLLGRASRRMGARKNAFWPLSDAGQSAR